MKIINFSDTFVHIIRSILPQFVQHYQILCISSVTYTFINHFRSKRKDVVSEKARLGVSIMSDCDQNIYGNRKSQAYKSGHPVSPWQEDIWLELDVLRPARSSYAPRGEKVWCLLLHFASLSVWPSVRMSLATSPSTACFKELHRTTPSTCLDKV